MRRVLFLVIALAWAASVAADELDSLVVPWSAGADTDTARLGGSTPAMLCDGAMHDGNRTQAGTGVENVEGS